MKLKKIKHSVANIKYRVLIFIGIFFTLNVLFLILNTPSFAADSSPSADLKAKIKQLQEEIASKAAQLKPIVSQKLQNRVYAGYIKAKTENTLTLATADGSKIASLNQFTQYSDKSSSKTSKMALKNLSQEDFVITLGDVDDNETLTAKRVIRITPLAPMKIQELIGNVISADETSISVRTKDQGSLTFRVGKSTVIKSKQENLTLKDILSGSTVAIVGSQPNEGTAVARLIYLISGPASLTITPAEASSTAKDATTSAKATLTPKKPSSTPKPTARP